MVQRKTERERDGSDRGVRTGLLRRLPVPVLLRGPTVPTYRTRHCWVPGPVLVGQDRTRDDLYRWWCPGLRLLSPGVRFPFLLEPSRKCVGSLGGSLYSGSPSHQTGSGMSTWVSGVGVGYGVRRRTRNSPGTRRHQVSRAILSETNHWDPCTKIPYPCQHSSRPLLLSSLVPFLVGRSVPAPLLTWWVPETAPVCHRPHSYCPRRRPPEGDVWSS